MDFNHRDSAITSIKQKLRVQMGQKVLIPAIHRHSGFLGSTPAVDQLALLGSTPAKTKRGKPVLAFPTAAKERQKIADKARREAGIAKRTRKFVIEEHYDDCGTDLSGLGADIKALTLEYLVLEPYFLTCDDPGTSLADGLETCWFQGTDADGSNLVRVPSTAWFATIPEAGIALMFSGPGDDVVEICGGEARVTTICIRRRLKSGGNFDLVTQCDLNTPKGQKELWDHLKVHRPLVVVMSPTCKPFGPRARQNRILNYQTWFQSYQEAAPHGRVCGEVALWQHNEGRYFIVEQPFPSELYAEPPWPTVIKQEGIVTAKIHQCMTGLQGRSGLLIKKPTGFVANDEELVKPLRKFVCNGTHAHEELVGSKSTSQAQIWT